MSGLLSESTPLLASFRSQRKNTSIIAVLSGPKLLFTYIAHLLTLLIRLFSLQTTGPILPIVAPSHPPAPDISAGSKDSSLVVVARSELPSTTYPISSLKKAPSCDSILPMKEIRSVRFSAIIDIHEFSRLVGEPVGMVPVSKAPGVRIPHIENELRYSREKARLALELEPAPMKSSYNHKLDDYNGYSSEPRYGSPIY